jgi:uncharacterized membrane protein
MVDLSFPRSRGRRSRRNIFRRREPEFDYGREIVAMACTAGLSAGLMYFLDPDRGRRRRHIMRDKVLHGLHVAEDNAGTVRRDLANRARGLAAVARRPFNGEVAGDEIIVDRVRAELGRVVTHPGAIEVMVDDGIVTLSGSILADEAPSLLRRTWRVRGVEDVVDKLDRHETAEDVPALQGNARPAGSTFELRQENWSPAARLMTGIAGGALMSMALREREDMGPLDALLGVAGLGLLTRATTNMPLDRVTGIGAGRKAVTVQKSITIDAAPDRVFAWLVDWEHWPEWMSHVHEVRVNGGMSELQQTHWTVDGPAGTVVSWEAVTTRVVPDELIAWKTVAGSPIKHAGRIRLVPTGEGTRVDVQLSYNPVLGAVGHTVAKFFSRDPKRQLDDDLARLKTTIETGNPPSDAVEPSELET